MPETHTWLVEGSHRLVHRSCALEVEEALARLPGVERVEADYRTNRVTVQASPLTGKRLIVEELARLAYRVR